MAHRNPPVTLPCKSQFSANTSAPERLVVRDVVVFPRGVCPGVYVLEVVKSFAEFIRYLFSINRTLLIPCQSYSGLRCGWIDTKLFNGPSNRPASPALYLYSCMAHLEICPSYSRSSFMKTSFSNLYANSCLEADYADSMGRAYWASPGCGSRWLSGPACTRLGVRGEEDQRDYSYPH